MSGHRLADYRTKVIHLKLLPKASSFTGLSRRYLKYAAPLQVKGLRTYREEALPQAVLVSFLLCPEMRADA